MFYSEQWRPKATWAAGSRLLAGSTDSTELFAVSSAKVQKQRNRTYVYLPTAVVRIVPWIAGREDFPIACHLWRGAAGGIQVDASLSQAQTAARDYLQQRPPHARHASSQWMHLVRFMAGAWSSKITAPSQPKLEIPAEVEQSGLLSFDELVVFAAGSVLELWSRSDWNAYLTAAPGIDAVRRGLEQTPFTALVREEEPLVG